ncbi:MAG: hypothetical protein QOF68_1954 [Gaiellales bacterium]|nr:hypothetical protein [Gaiellales bacterium]
MFAGLSRRSAVIALATAGGLIGVGSASAGVGTTEQVSVSPASADIAGTLQDATPDGQFAVFTSDGSLYLRNLTASTTEQVPVDGGPAQSARISDDGNLVLFAWTSGGRVHLAVRDIAAATTTVLDGPSGAPFSLAALRGMDISGNGSRIAIAAKTGGVVLLRTDTGAIRRGAVLTDPELTTDGRLVVGDNGTVCHADTDPVVCTALAGGPSNTASISAVGRFVAFIRSDRRIRLLDRTNGTVSDVPVLPNVSDSMWTSLQQSGLKISPNGKWVAYAAHFPDATRSGGVRTDGFLVDRFSKGTQRLTIGNPDMWGAVTPIFSSTGAAALFTAQLGSGTPTGTVAEKHVFDTTGPAAPGAPTVSLFEGGFLNQGSAPVEVSWNLPAGAFMAQARQSTVTVGNASTLRPLTTEESQRFLQHVGDTMSYRLRLADVELDTSDILASPATVTQLRKREETAGVYDGSWHVGTSREYTNDRDRWSDSPTSTVEFTFNGAAVAWVASVGVDRGIARVTIDGADQGTVDLSAPKAEWRKLVFAKKLVPGAHTMTITVLQSPGNDRVDVDGILFLAQTP